MLPLARFQSSRNADADVLATAFQQAGFTPERERSRARRAYGAAGMHGARPFRVEGKWSAGRTTDVPVLVVTMQAPLAGGQFRCHQTIPLDPPLPVPGDDTLYADGSPRAGLAAALAGRLGQELVALSAAAQNVSEFRACDDTVTLRLAGWPPSGRELTAAIDLCATLADALATLAPGCETETAAWAEAERRRLRTSRRVVLGMLAILGVPIVLGSVLLMPA